MMLDAKLAQQLVDHAIAMLEQGMEGPMVASQMQERIMAMGLGSAELVELLAYLATNMARAKHQGDWKK